MAGWEEDGGMVFGEEWRAWEKGFYKGGEKEGEDGVVLSWY